MHRAMEKEKMSIGGGKNEECVCVSLVVPQGKRDISKLENLIIHQRL